MEFFPNQVTAPSKADIMREECVKLCQSLIDLCAYNGPLQFSKSLVDISRQIEKTHKVERCLFLKVAGQGFTDGRDIKFATNDC
jgi:hypothetical protein